VFIRGYTSPVPGLFASETAVGYARVAVERGVDRYPEGLTYAILPPLADLKPGERVIVPLGKGGSPTAGYVIDVADSTELDPETIKPILRRDALSARLPDQLITLAKWISTYYCSPIGMTLATMLPAAVKKRIGAATRTFIDLGDPLPLDGPKLPAKQKLVLETLASLAPHERPIDARRLAALAGLKTPGPIRKLLERGLIERSQRTTVEAVWADHAGDAFTPESLTTAQQRIVSDIAAALTSGFSVHLLHGVTGSGKTEVYIRLIEQVIGAGKVALLLVPEISLTPQTGGRLIGRFPRHRVAVLHSGLTSAQRHQQWAMIAEDRAAIVLGARSAVFAPIPDGKLGLIIVDEEHDGSYKQDQSPRYHGRDVAIRRAQLARCPVLLGSATPSMESWHNATGNRNPGPPSRDSGLAEPGHRPKYVLHRLRERVPGASLPSVQIVDFREQQRAYRDKRVHLIGPVLRAGLERTLSSGGQALILINRRGYANYIACPDQLCGWVMQCDDCAATMVYHVNKKLPSGGYVRCHHCLAEQKLPAMCPQCKAHRISTFGLGTQRVEEELCREFPILVEGRTLLRVDSDTMHGSRDFHDALDRFGRGELRVLVGTQMIAKGLDFPGVRLVGVINADTSIHLPDFRAAERTFQLVSQVAGRSGRGTEPGAAGRVVVQTFNPHSPAIRLAAAHDYEGFAKLELSQRTPIGLPPIGRLTRIVVRDEDLTKCIALSRKLAEGLKAIASPEIRFRGPAPCPISRIAAKHRQQIEILAPGAKQMQELLAAARSAGILKPGAAVAVDVDPIALL
jgi:primosomal protein N' (replication factor Y) (superfamily II helicase)